MLNKFIASSLNIIIIIIIIINSWQDAENILSINHVNWPVLQQLGR